MITKHIKMTGVKDVCDMVILAQRTLGDVIIKKGHYVVDGKSLMGVFSLDMSDGVIIEYPKTADDLDDFLLKFEVR